MPKVIKPNVNLRMSLGFCFNNILPPPQILAASTVSSAQFQKRRNKQVMVSFGATAAGLF